MAGPEVGQGQIFLNGHVGSGAPEGVLEEAAYKLAPLVVRHLGDVPAV